MKELNLGEVKIPINAATKTFAVLAKRGAGKTWTAAVLAEEFFSANIPFVVFDPIDVWWGLRLQKNGKDKGLPVVVFGLEHADIKIDRDMGRRIAQEITRNNVSCVISTFGMPKVAQRHLIAEFSEELLNINHSPRHVFIEEAHEFVPQRVNAGMGKCFSSVEALVVMGRNRGIGVTLINQRAATINKDVLTQLDTLIALRNVGPQDRKALMEWVEQHSATGDFNKFINSLPSLPTGEAWIWSPEFMGIFKRFKVRARETFHPDREKIGQDFIIPDLDQVDIQGFISKFNSLPAKTKEVKEPPAAPQPLAAEIMALKNEYESAFMQKDMEIRRLTQIITNVQKAVGVVGSSAVAPVVGGNVEMWSQKLENGGAGKIFNFLSEKSGMKFTRSQLGLAVGISPKSSSLRAAMATLKRNSLIKEQGGVCWINPDL